MKLNFVQSIMAILISLLISYGLYSYNESQNKILLSIGSFVFLSATSVLTFGSSFELPRTTINIRVVSGVFFTIALVTNLIFAFQFFSTPSYILTNGILLVLFSLITYSINKSNQ
jgi:hypothetical protein